MKLNYTKGQFSVEFDADTQKDMFSQIASFQEVFGEEKCGKCGCTDLKYMMRTIDDNEFYELKCQSQTCGARLAYGANKKGGGLFPKKRDENKKPIPNDGWIVWKPGQ